MIVLKTVCIAIEKISSLISTQLREKFSFQSGALFTHFSRFSSRLIDEFFRCASYK